MLLDCVCCGGGDASDTDQDLENQVYLTIGTNFPSLQTLTSKAAPERLRH